jgi:predicted Fe-Mo cluster-binding NifX family protein
MAEKENLNLLGTLPLEPDFVRHGDQGRLAEFNDPELPFVKAFNAMVDKVIESTGEASSRPAPEEEKAQAPVSGSNNRTVFAVPLADGRLAAHFGHCEQFALVETEDGKITGTTMHTPPQHEPGVLPKWLHDLGANVIISGGMGSRAQQLFNENGIQVLIGAPADTPESLVNQYLSGALVTGDNICDH